MVAKTTISELASVVISDPELVRRKANGAADCGEVHGAAMPCTAEHFSVS